MLVKGKIYTTKNIINMFGGNIQSSMPFVNGRVPYCKFNPKINPEFPTKAWIEVGPRRKKGAEYLIQCNEKIPVFEKISVNKWIYVGKAKISNGSNSAVINRINISPPREKIQIILKLNFL